MLKSIHNIKARHYGSVYGLVINWEFHKKKRWVSAFSPFFVDAVIEKFSPVIIDTQKVYDRYKKQLKYVLSVEPGWAAPKIKYDTRLNQAIAVMASDPHNKIEWFQKYVIDNDINHVLSFYYRPFFYHFPEFPEDRFVHFPWAVPDQFVNKSALCVRSNEVAIFGAQAGGAYDVRNWCRSHPQVTSYNLSGVENKRLSDESYYAWLRKFDAIIAAGSTDPIYDLVTPKYFEITSAGALLVGQFCSDLEILGFNKNNSIIFTKDNFVKSIAAFRENPERFLTIRDNGRRLIADRHLISHRLMTLENLFNKVEKAET